MDFRPSPNIVGVLGYFFGRGSVKVYIARPNNFTIYKVVILKGTIVVLGDLEEIIDPALLEDELTGGGLVLSSYEIFVLFFLLIVLVILISYFLYKKFKKRRAYEEN